MLTNAESIKDMPSKLRSMRTCSSSVVVKTAVAQEGSLKLKEISYIHSEAYRAGELKHGTLALIEEGIPVIALATQEAVMEKTVSNIRK